MMLKRLGTIGLMAVVGTLLVTQSSLGKDDPKTAKDKHNHEHAGGSDDAMMAAWMKVAAPGEHHTHLAPLVGSWDLVVRWRMSPDGPWTDSKSVSTFKWILDGRFLEQHVEGEPMFGTPFKGMGMLGYDNGKKAYVSMWVDNMGTMMMTGEGSCDGSGKQITFMSKFVDPMSGHNKKSRTVYRIPGGDKFTMSMYETTPEGKEYESLQIAYTRKK
jgi:Protein of unknown function (DUF1579)